MTIQSEIQALKCADCARSDSAVSDLEPDSLLPIPADALTGWRDGRPGSDGVTRRKLLRNGVLGFAAVYGATQLSFEEVWESAVAQAAEPMQRSIVVVYLNGGNDGLNCFVPASVPEYAKYQSLRPTIARVLGDGTGATVGTTIMPNTGGNLAFSNKLVSGAGADRNLDTKGFDTLYGDGTGGAGSDLAIIPAADYNPPNRSHFESRDYWFAGALQQMQTGWLGRWLDLPGVGQENNPIQGLSLGGQLSPALATARVAVAAATSPSGYDFPSPGVYDDYVENAMSSGFDQLGNPGTTDPILRQARQAQRNASALRGQLATPLGTSSVTYPANNGLANDLRSLVLLLKAGLPIRACAIEGNGGFDTHSNQTTGFGNDL